MRLASLALLPALVLAACVTTPSPVPEPGVHWNHCPTVSLPR